MSEGARVTLQEMARHAANNAVAGMVVSNPLALERYEKTLYGAELNTLYTVMSVTLAKAVTENIASGVNRIKSFVDNPQSKTPSQSNAVLRNLGSLQRSRDSPFDDYDNMTYIAHSQS